MPNTAHQHTSTSRKLAAVLFSDIVGYTALMGKDSAKALELVRISKDIQKPLVEKHNGKWLKEMGDGAMAQFGSALDAVQCAIEIQAQARAKLDAKLRIGIHLGDITVEGDDIYGDGVNVASRIESIADPGGIYLSESVMKAVRGSTIEAIDLGEQSLKNVDYPVKIYAVRGVGLPFPVGRKEVKKNLSRRYYTVLIAIFMGVIGVAMFYYSQQTRNIEVSDKSIAVLPFKNLSSSQENQYFADGMMEDILNHLARIEELKVISRTSSDRYRDRVDKSLIEIAEELGIAFILEGSVRRNNNQVRIIVQLIDARKDEQLWSEDYDRQLTDIFAIQSEISQRIAAILNAKINPEVHLEIEGKPTENLTSYDHLLRGREAMIKFDNSRVEDDFYEGENNFRKAILLDSGMAMAYINLAGAFLVRHAVLGHEKYYLDTAMNMVDRAFALDSSLFDAFKLKADLYKQMGMNAEMKEMSLMAISLNPNSAQAYDEMANLARIEDRVEEGLIYAIKALELDPINPNRLHDVARGLEQLGYLEDAIKTYEKLLTYTPKAYWVIFEEASTYALTGKLNKAIALMESLGANNPKDPFYLHRTAELYAWAEKYEQARSLYEKYISRVEAPGFNQSDGMPPYRGRYAFVLWQLGDTVEAKALFEKQIEISKGLLKDDKITGFNEAYDLAGIYATMGNVEQAEYWINQLKDEDHNWAHWANGDPYFNNVRNTPAYQKKMKNWMNAREASRKRFNLLGEGEALSRMLSR
ncbi:MAG: hypothetical protein JXQ90_04920 [Cyclobacteriaceae bacterium]